MNIKKKRKFALPWLAPPRPTDDPVLQYYNPEYLCRLPTYQQILKRDGVIISLPGLHYRLKTGNLPHLIIDGIPHIMLVLPLQVIQDPDQAYHYGYKLGYRAMQQLEKSKKEIIQFSALSQTNGING